MNTPPGNNGKMVHYALASESAVLFDSVYCLSYYKKQSPYGFFEYNWGIDGYEAVVLGPEARDFESSGNSWVGGGSGKTF